MNDRSETAKDKGNGRTKGREPAFSVIDRRSTSADPAAADAPPRLPTYVEELKARAEEAERRAREISAAYRRIDEERDAFRERLSRDLDRRLEMARGDLLRKTLDVLDDLDRAIAAARAATDPAPLLAGVTLIRDRLFQVLASEGVEAVATAGQKFDPAVAEAIATEETPDAERDGLVLEESSRGYTLGGTLLRPARVRVARYRPPEPG
ncbi:MAG TPA: nucleotide exchange factor GrpE [Candidatus Polarisedimenticolia bacterium]|jgi:molecular chaperone GrpE|nr:nucleotide exchange factor GrpE [Candidatus Polarisedimenticolia bacterium]